MSYLLLITPGVFLAISQLLELEDVVKTVVSLEIAITGVKRIGDHCVTTSDANIVLVVVTIYQRYCNCSDCCDDKLTLVGSGKLLQSFLHYDSLRVRQN